MTWKTGEGSRPGTPGPSLAGRKKLSYDASRQVSNGSRLLPVGFAGWAYTVRLSLSAPGELGRPGVRPPVGAAQLGRTGSVGHPWSLAVDPRPGRLDPRRAGKRDPDRAGDRARPVRPPGRRERRTAGRGGAERPEAPPAVRPPEAGACPPTRKPDCLRAGPGLAGPERAGGAVAVLGRRRGA